VQNPFGAVLLRVTAIEAGTAQAFDAVKDVLRGDAVASKLANDRDVRAKVAAAHDRIEELRSSGKNLQQVAAELKRELVTVEAADAQGRDKAGEAVDTVPDVADVLKAAFQSDRGVDNEAIRTRENGYVWFEVQNIEPARERTFDEVKAQVDSVWRSDEAARITNESANGFLKRVEAGEALEAIANELGVNVETVERVTRNGSDAFAPSAAAAAFALAQGKFATAATGRGADRMILKVDSSSVPPFNAEDAATKSLKNQLDRTMADEWLNQYAGKVQADLGVSVNERALALATGAQTQR
jgi:peptidyl-prolyl cis-trans isomerase D